MCDGRARIGEHIGHRLARQVRDIGSRHPAQKKRDFARKSNGLPLDDDPARLLLDAPKGVDSPQISVAVADRVLVLIRPTGVFDLLDANRPRFAIGVALVRAAVVNVEIAVG